VCTVKRGFVSQGALKRYGCAEVGEDGATVRELLGPEPETGRVHASAAPALPDEQGARGAGDGLLEETDVVEVVGNRAGFGCRSRSTLHYDPTVGEN